MDSRKQRHNQLILYRRRMGFSQKQVARILGFHGTSMISHYEHGRALPPLSVALKLEIIYRAPVAFLFLDMYRELKERIRRDEDILAIRPVQNPTNTPETSAHDAHP